MAADHARLAAMRKQYHFRPSADGFDAWDVDRLIELAESSPIEDVALETITEIDSDYWYSHGYSPTVRSLVDHMRLVQAVDPSYPIVIDPDGRVMDGMHRVARALLDGRQSVPAKRLAVLPPADFTNCQPDDLPY